jgi:shikimate kinase
MKIFLIGFMGCGKSKLGRTFAAKFNRPFIDLDEMVELKYQMSIPDIFAAFGENGFREKERDVLQLAAIDSEAIIATGGGAPCFFDNMDWMNKNGITIFIDPPVKVLAERLINARVERPLVKGKNMEQLIDFIEMKLKERRPFYEQAQIILKEGDLGVDMMVNAIEKKLKSHHP